MKQDNQQNLANESISISDGLSHWIKTLSPLFQKAPTALCLADNEARIIYGNRAFLRLLENGAPAPTLTGQCFQDLFPHSKRIATRIENWVVEATQNSLKKLLHLPNQTRMAAHILVQPLLDAEGNNPVGAMISINDDMAWNQAYFTEESQLRADRIKQLSSDLMDKKSMIKTLMEGSPFGIALMDHDRHIIQINPAAEKLLGINRREAVGLMCSEVFQCYESNLGCPVLDGRKSIEQQETACLCRDKIHSTFLRSAVLSRERDEEIVLEAFIDITEMKEIQQLKEQAYRAKDDFFAKMSHELRTPLNAVIGYSELISDAADNISPKELREYSDAIQHGGYDLLHMVDQVLDISKLEEDKIDSHPYDFQPQAILDEVATTIRPMANKNNNQFSLSCAPDVGTVYTDPECLRRMLLNLLSNACKFTENGEVSLNVKREVVGGKDWMVFRVSDTGIGLTGEQMKRIFEKFEQADNTSTRQYSGSGLGLAIVKRLCELVNGKIEVESQLIQGTTFTLRLPCQPADENS